MGKQGYCWIGTGSTWKLITETDFLLFVCEPLTISGSNEKEGNHFTTQCFLDSWLFKQKIANWKCMSLVLPMQFQSLETDFSNRKSTKVLHQAVPRILSSSNHGHGLNPANHLKSHALTTLYQETSSFTMTSTTDLLTPVLPLVHFSNVWVWKEAVWNFKQSWKSIKSLLD